MSSQPSRDLSSRRRIFPAALRGRRSVNSICFGNLHRAIEFAQKSSTSDLNRLLAVPVEDRQPRWQQDS